MKCCEPTTTMPHDSSRRVNVEETSDQLPRRRCKSTLSHQVQMGMGALHQRLHQSLDAYGSIYAEGY
ncbi:MAG: hypothetical protein KatS3mg104_2499 [Phycisphaerae bacterium]|jgi:hypothetical protein|nr:MAG: hypothetical protein KatS3mg104_2499 [Phycisphaerae bacterium]